ncbi:MAG: hypothetical protein GC184_14400 [Rhizobiales bacterium]|nr:hypothetical protein [Hyphomicrobiales bacterium]
MPSIALKLGPLVPEGCIVRRSGFRWLCADGAQVKAGEPVAYCNIGVTKAGTAYKSIEGFAEETFDFQVAFVLQSDGVVHRAPESSRGGYIDQLVHFHQWNAEYVLGSLTVSEGDLPRGKNATRLVFAAGRRVTDVAEIRSGFISGWHNRTRAWTSGPRGVERTLISLGSCETTLMIRGDNAGYMELLNGSSCPMQVVLVPDDFLIPCARVVLEQVRRTPSELDAIAQDLANTLPKVASTPSSEDWMLAGVLLGSLKRSPLTEPTEVLTRAGLQTISGPDAVVMSLIAEPPRIFRHRRLGYAICFMDHRLKVMGQAFKEWLRDNFVAVRREAEDIRKDYSELIKYMHQRSALHFIILNRLSSRGTEDLFNYAPFDPPMGNTLESIHNKEMNLMLYDLAREHEISIIDIDAFAAELGERRHLPDAVHLSGSLQDEARNEILRVMDTYQPRKSPVSAIR